MKAVGGGTIINVSSVAANYPVDQLMAYGISKIGLERLSIDVARQVNSDNIAVNVFRIDLPVASEGFVANTPGADHSNWEPAEVAAEGILWMIDKPIAYSGQRESMWDLRRREGIMPSRVASPWTEKPAEDLVRGVLDVAANDFEEPYTD
jgi:NAD(P)-dependent dehydrogenase (short-subunit alcohol dehydrogenase family)